MTFAGNLLVRNTRWTPARISTALWLDAADSSTIIESGGTVSQWSDKSGNEINTNQSTTASKPLFNPSGLNSLPSIDFDGNDDFLNFPSGFLFGATAVSVAFVLLGPLQPNDPIFAPRDTNRTGLELVYTSAVNWPTLIRVNNVNKILSGLWSTNETPTITTIQANTNFTSGWLNGNIISAFDPTGITALNFNGIYSLGKYAGNIGSFCGEMKISEFIISSNTWSLEIRQKIEGYLAHKWGLTANLPSGHPYKNNPPRGL